MQQPRWLDEAWRELGQREIAGSADNPRIMALYRDAGVDDVAHDEVAWCAAFVGACLKRAGFEATGSLMARSYSDWGEPADTAGAALGAVVVLKRGGDPSLGHVGFLIGETDSSLLLLGGNQANAVSVAAFPRDEMLAIRWPPSSGAAQAAPSAAAADDRFEAALAHELEMEGGWTDDPADPGGPTNLGMTLADLASWHGVALDDQTRPALLDELRRLDVAAVRPIYRERYWIASHADVLPTGLALMHFDCAVNQGLGRASRFLQQAVGADVDGEIGPLTLAAAGEVDESDALAVYADLRRAHYAGLASFARFGRGWLARVDKTLARARALANVPVKSDSPNSKGDTRMTAPQTPAPPSPNTGAQNPTASDPKWWGQSMTIWGTLITAAATVAPVLGPVIGVDLSPDTIKQIGGQATDTVRALAGLAGTLMAIYGRTRAAQPLVRRDVTLKL